MKNTSRTSLVLSSPLLPAVRAFAFAFVLALGLGVPAAHAAGRRCLAGAVNLNTATAEELQLLPGVGAARAEAIIAYRKVRPFRTVEELGRIKGIGRKTVKKLRPHLQVDGPSTLRSATCPAEPAADTQP